MKKIRAALLGATGAVGQRYINMLDRHPFITLEVLMGGESAGKKYGQAVHWLFPDAIPERFAEAQVRSARPESAEGCDVVFSALPSEVAGEIEQDFARSGFTLVSEASSHRMDADVPLMIPGDQPGTPGAPRDPEEDEGLEGRNSHDTQLHGDGAGDSDETALGRVRGGEGHRDDDAGSLGSGLPGVPSLAITENVIPYIKNEEEKVAKEAKKILGAVRGGVVVPHEIPIGISCNRVQVIDGHTETLYGVPDAVRPAQVVKVLERFAGAPQKLKLPTAPERPIIVRKENDRPQPRLDRMAGSVPGMSVVVGRVRNGIDERSLQLTLLSHNTIRGAAGTAILTAELMQREGYIG